MQRFEIFCSNPLSSFRIPPVPAGTGKYPPPAIQATRRLQMAPCAKRDTQRVPRQLGVAMGACAADPRCAADPHFFSPAAAAAFLRATSHRRVAAEQLVVRCAGPADASAGGGLKSAMAALTAFMSCGSRAAAAYARCSPSRGAGLARRPIASGGRVFQGVSGVSTFLGIFVRTLPGQLSYCLCESENGCGFFRDSVSPSPGKSTCNVQQSKWRRWNDNCTGRTGSHGEASPLEPAALSEQAAAKAGQMATKRKREPLELSPAEAERRSKKAEASSRRREEIKKAGGPDAYRALSQASKKRKLSQLGAEEAAKVLKKAEAERWRREEVKKAGGPDAYRALSQARKEQKMSQLSAEEAAKVLKQRAYNEQYYAEAKTAGGKRKREPLELSPAEAERRSKNAEAERWRREEVKKAGGPDAYRALSQARKEQKMSQLSAEEAAKVLKQRAYNEQYYAEAKTAGGKARLAERKPARKARKARMAERKARKARMRARARAKAWCGPIDPFEMAAEVQTALQLPGMVLQCLLSVASSAGRVQKWAQFVGNYCKTAKAKRKKVACFDMEGHANKKKTHPPYSASLLGLGPAENWFMNPSQNGVLSTVRECRVCSKPQPLNPKP
jgi:hypothetical protein